MLKCHVQIILNSLSADKTMAVADTLGPDNVNFPRGQSLKMTHNEGRLVLDFESTGDLKKLVGTVDEILEHIQVALKVMEQ